MWKKPRVHATEERDTKKKKLERTNEKEYEGSTWNEYAKERVKKKASVLHPKLSRCFRAHFCFFFFLFWKNHTTQTSFSKP